MVVALLALVAVVACTTTVVVASRYRRLRERTGEVGERLADAVDVEGSVGGGDPGARLARSATAVLGRMDVVIERAAYLDQALGGIPQGVVVATGEGRVVYRNPVAEAYSEARHGEALVEAAVREVLDEAVRGVPARRTLDLFGPPRRTLVITGHPLGQGSGGLAMIDDVSERRRLDAVRRDFVANISHELRTPVGALGLLAETMLEEEDPGIRARLAQRMLAESDRVARTIEDLLTLSQIESEEIPEREPVQAGLVVAEAVERIRPAADQRGIEVSAPEPSHRLAMFGDRRQLVSALYNLLDNAVKYSDPGSRVSVEARTDGLSVDISVTDHGIGIPDADLQRIFERFYRVDQARSRQTGGTGLGLAIVRHVVSNHDGEVLVRSSVGEGSVFTLRLPSASGPVAVESAEAS